MNLFSQASPQTDPTKTRQIKAWVYEILGLDTETPISISQLRCTEPDCPPIETVIAVMTTPIHKYKIHKSLVEIEYTDISEALKK